MPYSTPKINLVDIFASTTTFITIILGIFYLDTLEPKHEYILIIIFVFLVLFNMLFVLYWITAMAPLMRKIILECFGKIKKLHNF